jgi:hypothetical protein
MTRWTQIICFAARWQLGRHDFLPDPDGSLTSVLCQFAAMNAEILLYTLYLDVFACLQELESRMCRQLQMITLL